MKAKLICKVGLGLLVGIPALLHAEEKKLSGEVGIGAIVGQGRRDSAKSEEYRDLSNGPGGDLKLKYSDKESGYYSTLTGENIDREDMNVSATGGRYGEFKYKLTYDQTPHRFAYGASSIYTGGGSETLSVPEAVRTDLSNATSEADLVNRLNNTIADHSHDLDFEVMRSTWTGMAQYEALKPYRFKVDISNENRDGEKPSMGSFGFGNVVEIIEPVNYRTSQLRLTGDYSGKGTFVSANYYASIFENSSGSLTYDNPFRLSDSTASDAYTNPRFVNGGFSNNGPEQGLVSLAPSNFFHGPSVNASFSDFPWKTRVNLSSSLGWMMQDEDFSAYTSNSAIQGADGLSTFSASDRSNLPVTSADASVATSLYSVGVISHPTQWLDTSVKYRYYDYNNNTDPITFPGYVLFDSSWVADPITSQPTSYTKQNGTIDVGFRMPEDTRLGLLYKYINTHRENREVANQNENIVGVSIDRRFSDLVNVNASHQKSYRDVGNYDFTKPYGNEAFPNQLPLLRKYYEASREMDSENVLVTVTPTEDLDITGGFVYSNSNFDESVYGLLDDRSYQLSADVSYTVTKSLSLNSSYSYEHHNGNQAARQWTAGGIGDPYFVDTGYSSNSNWTAETEDVIHTIGAGATATLIASTLFVDLNYTYAMAQGNIAFASPLGRADTDSNPFVPGSFGQVDNSAVHRLNPALRYKITKDATLSLGYLWERASFSDFATNELTAIPTNASGASNGAILGGAYPIKDYDVSVGYLSLRYKF